MENKFSSITLKIEFQYEYLLFHLGCLVPRVTSSLLFPVTLLNTCSNTSPPLPPALFFVCFENRSVVLFHIICKIVLLSLYHISRISINLVHIPFHLHLCVNVIVYHLADVSLPQMCVFDVIQKFNTFSVGNSIQIQNTLYCGCDRLYLRFDFSFALSWW